MQPEQIIGQLLGALVGRKRKRRSGLLGMALGGRSTGGLLAGGTLLTAAGLVWGALESMQKSTVAGGAGSGAPPGPSPSRVMPSPDRSVGNATPGMPVVPPPLPAGAAVVPPPLPGVAAGGAPGTAGAGADAPMHPAAAAALPLLRLAIGAAHADGELSDEEREFIRTQAGALGIAAAVDQALRERPAIADLTAAFESDEQRRAAYAIAYAVIHGDGVVSPGERMYLTQLARSLRLPHEDVETIERDALGKE